MPALQAKGSTSSTGITTGKGQPFRQRAALQAKAVLQAKGSTTGKGQHYRQRAALQAKGKHFRQEAALQAKGSTTGKGQHYRQRAVLQAKGSPLGERQQALSASSRRTGLLYSQLTTRSTSAFESMSTCAQEQKTI